MAGDSKKKKPQGMPRCMVRFKRLRREKMNVKMKIFTGNGDTEVLEGELNEWLEKNPYITVKTIKQSCVASGDRLFAMVSLWYDK
jgi:hypothetical protein